MTNEERKEWPQVYEASTDREWRLWPDPSLSQKALEQRGYLGTAAAADPPPTAAEEAKARDLLNRYTPCSEDVERFAQRVLRCGADAAMGGESWGPIFNRRLRRAAEIVLSYAGPVVSKQELERQGLLGTTPPPETNLGRELREHRERIAAVDPKATDARALETLSVWDARCEPRGRPLHTYPELDQGQARRRVAAEARAVCAVEAVCRLFCGKWRFEPVKPQLFFYYNTPNAVRMALRFAVEGYTPGDEPT